MEQALLSIAREAYRTPREAAVQLLSLGIPRQAILPGFGAIVLISVVVSGAADVLVPQAEDVPISYITMAVLLGVILLSFTLGVWKIGQGFGGSGSFEESLTIGIFFQTILLPFQILQIILAVAMPSLAGIYAIGLLFYGVWMNVQFIDALHGLASFGKSLGVLLLSSFVAAVALLIVAAFFGQSPVGAV
ncbi:MAG: hypothetical protein KJO42_06640 [Silicimonas sp.]|nr:hypothetical protein [Silicimonas sp.]NNF90788.1 hypothetical protein [Boseongicola sp.]RZW12400.1 MAG: hypothetical protein EX266_01660 [Paracoccaceae bacterium]MBT8424478.1 hypothetical protein [Silicimonas sp.]NND17185.1 hypothetical protein [Silicimonas sp.]